RGCRLARRVRFAGNPLPAREVREKRITLYRKVDAGQVDAIGLRQRLGIELASADEHDFLHALLPGPLIGTADGSVQAGKDFRTFKLQPRLAADHQIETSRQWPAERIPGPAAHDDGLAQGQRLEVPEVLWQMPGHAVVQPDHPIMGAGGDQTKRQRRFHQTATGALIWGWD